MYYTSVRSELSEASATLILKGLGAISVVAESWDNETIYLICQSPESMALQIDEMDEKEMYFLVELSV